MIKRIFKKTPIIIITAILLSIPINTIYAYTFNVEFADTGSSSSSSGKPGENGSSGNQEPKYSKELSSKTSEKNGYKYKETYTCKYNYNISSKNKVTINGYNMQNKRKEPSDELSYYINLCPSIFVPGFIWLNT